MREHRASSRRSAAVACALVLGFALVCTSCSAASDLTATPKPRLLFASPTPSRASATATPAHTPTPVPPRVSATLNASALDAVDLVLTLDDFPAGFEELPPGELGFSEGMELDAGFTIESFFSFLEPENLEIVFGFTTLIPTRLEQARFDRELRSPDRLLAPMIAGMNDVEVLEQRVLPELSDIGDGAVGATVAFKSEGIAWRLDIVVFRRAGVGAFVAAMYLDEDTPAVGVSEVADNLDSRLSDALQACE
jgi:hypothetical protein